LHVSLILDERGRYLGYLPSLLIERRLKEPGKFIKDN
jgi:hypothetical protein